MVQGIQCILLCKGFITGSHIAQGELVDPDIQAVKIGISVKRDALLVQKAGDAPFKAPQHVQGMFGILMFCINEGGLEVILCSQVRMELFQVKELQDALGAAHDLFTAFEVLPIHGQKLDHIADQTQQGGILLHLGVIFCLLVFA